MPRIRPIMAACATLSAAASVGLSSAAAAPAPDPANFSAKVDNPWFPLKPGSVLRYQGMKDGKRAVDVLEVTHRTKRIQGVPNVVVRDRLFLNGRLAENTTDWYSQDRQGNVWYFGEDTSTLDARGRVVSREGSFQAGVDGAQAGIFITAHPKVGQSHRQEFYKGHAEDHFTVVALAKSVKVPFLTSSKALLTHERTPLEPKVLDAKYYVRGIGTVKEIQLKGPGPRELLELVSFKRH